MRKKLLSLLLSLMMIFGLAAVATAPAMATQCSRAQFINTSWYGKYVGYYSSSYVERCLNLTITDCDSNGNLTGKAYVTTEVKGHTSEWLKYDFKGKVDFRTGNFTMQGTKITSHSSGVNWSMVKFTGTYGDSKITGIVDGTKERTFTFGIVSAWAKDEITQADLHGLIPETMYGKDLSQPITRAEFAAVAVKLYESLTETKTGTVATPFVDIKGNVDADNIAKAYNLNVAVGISATEFAPNRQISREELATMLCRTVKKYKFPGWTYATDNQYYLDTSGAKVFADDGDISDWAKPSVYYMSKMGIINGIDATHFAPKAVTEKQKAECYATATREQAVALAVRIYNLADALRK